MQSEFCDNIPKYRFSGYRINLFSISDCDFDFVFAPTCAYCKDAVRTGGVVVEDHL